MGKLTINIAKQLLRLIQGEHIPFGQLKSKVVDQMIEDGILHVKLQGRSRKVIFTIHSESVINFLSSQYGINDLEKYIYNLEYGTSRAENVLAASDSKSSSRRTFKGFLVNCYDPIHAEISEKDFVISPHAGTYTYIYDFETFTVANDVLIVGVENSENFRFIHQQKHLFGDAKILFVSRYPQSKDLISWLQQILNKYLHFGDFDFEGIRIFRDEYYHYLDERASFYVPNNLEDLLESYGNKSLYDKQYRSNASVKLAINDDVDRMIQLFHKHKKCLEQEVLIVR